MSSPTARLVLPLAILAAVAVSHCDNSIPVGPTPQDEAFRPLGPSFAISDATRSGGNAEFYWLPPLQPSPSYGGTFDGSLSPVVQICEWSGGVCVMPLVAEFTSGGGGSDRVRVAPEDEHYIVNWHTGRFGLDEGTTYRIKVLVAGTELAFADVDVVAKGKDLKGVDAENFVGVVNGGTLPIKFRIEEGAVFVAGVDGGTFTTPDGNAELVIPAGALPGPVGITIQQTSDPTSGALSASGATYDFRPNGTIFALPVQITIRYDESTLPATLPETFLSLLVEGATGYSQVFGSGPNVAADEVTGTIDHFTNFTAGSTFSVTILPPVGGPFGMNNSAQVVGTAGTGAVFWDNDGTGMVLPTLPGFTGTQQAQEINDAGQAVGLVCQPGNSVCQAVRWDDPTQQPTPLPLFAGDNWGAARGINSLGQSAGSSRTTVNTALFWESDGTLTPLGGVGGRALDITDNGLIVGTSSAFGGTYWQLPGTAAMPLPTGGFGSCFPRYANESGQIVGTCNLVNPSVVLWPSSTTAPIDLGPGSGAFGGEGINEAGEIAANGNDGKTIFDSSLNPINLEPGGSALARAINDSGQVVGHSSLGITLWTPVP